MIDANKICLLLTGCINPSKDVAKIAVRSPNQRRKQTVEAIEFYIKHTRIRKIVYCDNSNAPDIDELDNLARNYCKAFEWISFSGNTKQTIIHGKGFGEGEIIAYAINHSKLITDSELLMKVTGRLVVKNTNTLLSVLHKGRSYLDYHNGYIDTRCYIVKLNDYMNYLIHSHEFVNDDNEYYLEHEFYKVAISAGNIFYPFPIACNIIGISGSMGIEYKDDWIRRFAKSLKALLRSIKWHIKKENNQ